jgi:hypothetical protein
VPAAELEKTLHYFPLNADLHQAVGLRELQATGPGNTTSKSAMSSAPEKRGPTTTPPVAIHAINATKPDDTTPEAAEKAVQNRETVPALPPQPPIMTSWQRHFGIAARLQPASWELPMAQARACQRVGSGLAVSYWQQAVERGGIHRDELLATAVRETARFPNAQSTWGRYAEAHPKFLLAYAQTLPPPQARYYFGRWWKLRANADDLTDAELRALYTLAGRWGNLQDFQEWMKNHATLAARDYRQWAALLHGWGADEEAWQLLAPKVSDPAFPPALPNVSRETLEKAWRAKQDSVVTAQQLAQIRRQAGDKDGSDEIIIGVANGENPPPWFLDKAAWLLARGGRMDEAVELALRPR